MKPTTINQVNELQTLLHAGTRTDVVKTSLDVAELVIRAINGGGAVVVEDKSGKRERIVIPGIRGSRA
jgi:hypothetical protein